MDRFELVRNLMALNFGVTPEEITFDTVRADIPEWDSVGNLNLMLSIEDTFDITLEVEEIVRLGSVRTILDLLDVMCPSR